MDSTVFQRKKSVDPRKANYLGGALLDKYGNQIFTY